MGTGIFDIQNNLNYWNIYFSSPKNKFYKSISSNLTQEKIKVVDNSKTPSKKRTSISNISHPLFYLKQSYGRDLNQVILSSLNIDLL